MTSNKTIRFHKFGGPDVLQVDELPIPEPNENEVRIRVKALGISRVEDIYRSGEYSNLPLPSSIGFEASGVVDKIGQITSPHFDILKIGDSVSVLQTSLVSNFYTHGEYIIQPISSITKNNSFSHIEGASIWFAYLTAYYALVSISHIKSGDWVLVTGGSSSTALAASHIVKSLGGKVIITSRSSSKKDKIMEISGADVFLNTEDVNWTAEIKKITNGLGVNCVYDFALASGTVFNSIVESTAYKGTIVLYGEPKELIPFSPRSLFSKYINLKAYLVYEFTSDPVKLKEGIDFIHQLRKNSFKSFVTKTYKGIDKVIDAHRDLSTDNFGKIVVEL